jgi:catechol 2,3-dioxygenase-like lactoylglutathione lyase family enzyme
MKLHHVAIAVSNMQKSITFYKKLLGLNEGRSFQNSNQMSEITYLEGEEFSLELTSRGGRMVASVKRNQESRYKHMAFLCKDINAFHDGLILIGFEVSHIKIKELENFVISYFFVNDPDGNEIEFIEYTTL